MATPQSIVHSSAIYGVVDENSTSALQECGLNLIIGRQYLVSLFTFNLRTTCFVCLLQRQFVCLVRRQNFNIYDSMSGVRRCDIMIVDLHRLKKRYLILLIIVALSGWTTVTTVLLATLRIIKKKDLNEAITLFISVLFFIFFSEPTELKMGRNNMLVFVVTCTLFSLAVMRGTTHKYTGIRSLEEIPIHQIIRACGSACLCYLAIAASNPNEIFFIKGVVIQKHFRWNGLKMEYSQVIKHYQVTFSVYHFNSYLHL